MLTPFEVPIVWLIDTGADPRLGLSLGMLDSLLSGFQKLQQEVTVRYTQEGAQRILKEADTSLKDRIRRQDAAFGSSDASDKEGPGTYLETLDWKSGAAEFHKRELPAYLASFSLTSRIPSTFAEESWAPQAYSSLEGWGVRVLAAEHTPIVNDDRPFFLAGRLHFTGLGPYWINLNPLLTRSTEENFANIAQLSDQVNKRGGIICLHFSLAASGKESDQHGVDQILEIAQLLREIKSAKVVSARQVADKFADISYEHRIPYDEIRAIADHAMDGRLRPFLYQHGYLSPAEQLYLLASAWSENRRKGKLIRNSTTRTALGPCEYTQTDPQVTGIPAEEVETLLQQFLNHFSATTQLPASLKMSHGSIAIQDFLPTLAAGFHDSLSLVGLQLRRGELVETEKLCPDQFHREKDQLPSFPPHYLEMTRLQLWNFKPVVDMQP